MNFYKIFRNVSLIASILLLFNGCSMPQLPKPDWSKTYEPDGKKRARKNVEEGRGFSLGIGSGKKGGDFLFASANPMWRASLETLDFITLATVDYAGGLIISDWYSEGNTNESIKITIRFLSNEIRVDGLNVTLHKKVCNNNNCSISKIESDLNLEIKDAILRRAAILKTESDKTAKKNRPKKKWGDASNNK
jgi:hypothetical protein